MKKLRAWYAGLQERERRIVIIGTLAVSVIILVGGILMPLQSAVSKATQRSDTKRADLEWMKKNAAEVRSSIDDLPVDTGEAPVVLVDRVGREAGLGSALRGTQPNANGVRVQLEAAPFDVMIQWIDTLDRHYGLAVESISVDRTAAPGMVNASVTFTQPRH
jgi:general secretion pathway protein M